MTAYVAPRRLRNGHWMTLYVWGRPRHFPGLPPPVPRYVRVAPGSQVLAHCYWQREPWKRPTILALHGLEGSSSAPYMRGLAHKAWAHGFNAVCLNQRNCGGTEHLSNRLYHSGLTADPDAVIRELAEVDGLRSIGLVGYSLGGNLALKLAGEYGEHGDLDEAHWRSRVRAVVAVSPTIELAACVEALERRQNWIYQWNFVRSLKRRMRRKARLDPARFPLDGLSRVRTVRDFDERFTAPHHGFRDAADYYHRASAMRVVSRIRIPTLILTAADDPFIPLEPFRDPSIASNPAVTVIISPHGGHCGFYTADRRSHDGYWAEWRALEFLSAYVS